MLYSLAYNCMKGSFYWKGTYPKFWELNFPPLCNTNRDTTFCNQSAKMKAHQLPVRDTFWKEPSVLNTCLFRSYIRSYMRNNIRRLTKQIPTSVSGYDDLREISRKKVRFVFSNTREPSLTFECERLFW